MYLVSFVLLHGPFDHDPGLEDLLHHGGQDSLADVLTHKCNAIGADGDVILQALG